MMRVRGLADGMTASSDLAQQRVLTRRRLVTDLRIPIAVTVAVAVLNVGPAPSGTSVGIELPPSLVLRYYDQPDHVQESRSLT